MKNSVLKNIKYLIGSLALNFILVEGQGKLCCNEKTSEPQELQHHYIVTIRDELMAAKAQGYTITPNAGPAVKGGVDMYVELEYIYWYVEQGGLAYAQQFVPEAGLPNVSNSALTPGPVVRPSFTFSSGFKAGLGADTDYDGWGVGTVYTFIHSKANSEFGTPDVQNAPSSLTLWEANFSVLPLNQRDDLATFQISAQNGNAEWTLFFNTVDLDIGRAFFVSPYLILRPHFGLKGAWMKQRFHVFYNEQGISSLINTRSGETAAFILAQEDYNIQNKQYFWGVGPRIGLDTMWAVINNLSCFTELSFSGVWGQFTESRIDISNVTDLITHEQVLRNSVTLNNTDKFNELIPVFEMQIGFQYDHWCCDAKYRMRLQASWEVQTWFDQNHFIKQGIYGNLNLQGLTINLRFDF